MASQEKVVYLLHGWAIDPNNKQKWMVFRGLLTEQGIKTKFIDLPGLSKPLNQVWQLDDYVDYVSAQISGENNILLGHSFGGQIAARLAASHPDQVSKLILIDPSGLRPNDIYSKTKRAAFRLAAKTGRRFTKSTEFKKLLYKLAGEHDYLEADKTLRQTMANVISTDISTDLTKITQPTLLLWGSNDKVTPLSLAKRFSELLSSVELHIIENARHSPQFTHPEITAKKVLEFIGE